MEGRYVSANHSPKMSDPTRSDEAIFAAALLHESPSARAAYLAVACAGDTALQARVEGLLRASASAAAFLERPIAVPRPSSPPTASPGSRPLDLDALALVSALALALARAGLGALPAFAASPPSPGILLTTAGQWPGYPRGSAESVAVSGDHAFVATPTGFQALDVTASPAPRIVGSADVGGSKVVVSGGFAYVASFDAGMHILNIQDPTRPWRVGGLRTEGAFGLAVAGTQTFIADVFEGLVIVDASQPTNATRVGVYRNGNEVPQCSRVAVSGRWAYLNASGGASGVEIVDIGDPAHPVRVTRVEEVGSVVELAAEGNFVFVASVSGFTLPRLHVLEVADPARPKSLGSYPLGAAVSGVHLAGSRVYVSDLDGLRIFDRTDPGHLVQLALVPSSSTAVPQSVTLAKFGPNALFRGVAVSGNRACVAAGAKGLIRYDVTSPASPVQAGVFGSAGSAHSVAVEGNLAYVADDSAGLQVVELSPPDRPATRGHLGLDQNVTRIRVSGKRAYLTYYDPWGDVLPPSSGGIYVADIQDPDRPALIGRYAPGHGIADVVVAGSLAYVAYYGDRGADDRGVAPKAGLRILDFGDPAHPVVVGNHVADDVPTTLALEGTRVFLAGDSGLEIVDVLDPARPVRRGTYRPDGTVIQVAVRGTVAYAMVARASESIGEPGLHVVDVSDPAHPVRMGLYQPAIGVVGGDVPPSPPPPVVAYGLQPSGSPLRLAGDRLFAVFAGYTLPALTVPSGFQPELQVFDVRDPAHPVRLDRSGLRMESDPTDLEIADGHVWLATGNRGLLVAGFREVPRLLEIRRHLPSQAVLTFAAPGADPSRFAVESASSLGAGADWKVEDVAAPIALRADGLFEATVTPPEAGAGTSLRGDAKFYRVRASP